MNLTTLQLNYTSLLFHIHIIIPFTGQLFAPFDGKLQQYVNFTDIYQNKFIHGSICCLLRKKIAHITYSLGLRCHIEKWLTHTSARNKDINLF